jgi:hypothetical protein
LEALTDRPRRPIRYANQLPAQIEGLIVSLKRDMRQTTSGTTRRQHSRRSS